MDDPAYLLGKYDFHWWFHCAFLSCDALIFNHFFLHWKCMVGEVMRYVFVLLHIRRWFSGYCDAEDVLLLRGGLHHFARYKKC